MDSIGIDFGTGNSVLAGWLANKPQIFTPKGASTPNISSDMLVSADGKILTEPTMLNQPPASYRRITGIKRRLLNLDQEPPEEREMLIKLAESRIMYLFDSFRKEQGNEVYKAVLTCPANASRAYRDLLYEIGQRCGLPAIEIVDEPTAAGAHHGRLKVPPRDERWVVVDWGCGTCDISFILRKKDTANLDVQHIVGDNRLGGMDMDGLLRAHLAKRYGFPPEACPLWQVEALKIKLSTQDSAEATLVLTDGRNLTVQAARSELEGIIRPLLDQACELIHAGMVEVQWDKKGPDAVIGTGGPMLMPAVRRVIAETLDMEEEDCDFGDPLTSVAQGAARLAELKRTGTAYTTGKISNPIGVRVVKGSRDDVFLPVIVRNESTPILNRPIELATSVDLQDIIAIEIREGMATSAEANTLLGRLNVVVRPEDKGKVKVRLLLTVTDSSRTNALVEPLGDAGSVREVERINGSIVIERNATSIATGTAIYGDPLKEFDEVIRLSSPDPDTARQIYERLKIKYHPDRYPEKEKKAAEVNLQHLEAALNEYLQEVQRRMQSSSQPEQLEGDKAALDHLVVDEVLAQRLAHCLAFNVPGKASSEQMVRLLKRYPDYRRVLAAYLSVLKTNEVLQKLLAEDDRPHVGLVVLLQNLPGKPIRERHEVLKAAYRMKEERVRELLKDPHLDGERLYQAVKNEAEPAENPMQTARGNPANQPAPTGSPARTPKNVTKAMTASGIELQYEWDWTWVYMKLSPQQEAEIKRAGFSYSGKRNGWFAKKHVEASSVK